MSEKKLFVGITLNECIFQGRVVDEPQFVPNGDNEYVFVNIATYVREPDANGQWVDNEIIIPLLIMEASKVKVIKDYVEVGRQIKVNAHYKNWDNNGQEGHALIVNKIQLGDKPYNKENTNTAKAGPNLPPA